MVSRVWLPTRRELLLAAAALTVAGQPQPAFGLSINPRSSWATDRPPKGALVSENVRFLLVHHSASRNGHTGADAPAILRSFFDFHTGEKGWNDIAYNFLIDADGGIWEGRAGSLSGPIAGDATGGNQGFSQLVCIIGDYNAVEPTSRSLDSLVRLLAWMADRYDVSTVPGAETSFVSRGSNKWAAGTTVTTPTITGHRTMSKTTCPGDLLHAYVASGLTADVERARGGSAPPPAPSTTAPPITAAATTTPTTASTTTPSTTSTSTTSTSTTTTSTTSSTTTTTHATTTSATASATTPPTTAVPLAAAPGGEEVSPWLLTGAGALVAVGAGLVVWRQRRLGGG